VLAPRRQLNQKRRDRNDLVHARVRETEVAGVRASLRTRVWVVKTRFAGSVLAPGMLE